MGKPARVPSPLGGTRGACGIPVLWGGAASEIQPRPVLLLQLRKSLLHLTDDHFLHVIVLKARDDFHGETE